MVEETVMTAMIIIITIIIPTLSARLCVCVFVCVRVSRHVSLEILYTRLREVFMNLVHLHGV